MQVPVLQVLSKPLTIMADETPRSIVELPPPECAQMKPEEPEATPAIVPPAPDAPPAPKKDEPDDDPTGVENVVVDETPPPRPANWQEAVKDHLTPKPKPEQPEEEAAPQFGNMQDVIDFLEERKAAIHLPTKEELEKERRRKKTEGIISAIADGASAISNLIFTTQYAPNMYQQENSMTDKMRERYDRIKKERDADADRYLNYALTIGKLKDAQDAREYQHGRDALQDQIRMSQEARAQLKADRDAALADLKMQLMTGKISEQDAAARAKEIEAEYADQYWNARVDEIKSRKKKNDRWQPSAGRRGTGGGGRPAEHAWRDKNGNLHYCHSESAARSQAAANGGTYVTTPTRRVTTKPDKWGNPSTTETETDVSTPKVTIDWN